MFTLAATVKIPRVPFSRFDSMKSYPRLGFQSRGENDSPTANLTRKREGLKLDCMKTVLELPESLVREIEVCAAHRGRKVEEFCADLVIEGMSQRTKDSRREIDIVPKTLPHMKVRPVSTGQALQLTTQEWCEWIKNEELQLDVMQHEAALGHQHLDRPDA